MTAHGNSQRSARPIHSEPTTHLYAIGQTVQLRGGYGVFTSRFGDIYKVTARLPPSGNTLQYRIRNDREQHERVASEDSLTVVDAVEEPSEGTALVKKTFRR